MDIPVTLHPPDTHPLLLLKSSLDTCESVPVIHSPAMYQSEVIPFVTTTIPLRCCKLSAGLVWTHVSQCPVIHSPAMYQSEVIPFVTTTIPLRCCMISAGLVWTHVSLCLVIHSPAMYQSDVMPFVTTTIPLSCCRLSAGLVWTHVSLCLVIHSPAMYQSEVIPFVTTTIPLRCCGSSAGLQLMFTVSMMAVTIFWGNFRWLFPLSYLREAGFMNTVVAAMVNNFVLLKSCLK